MSLRKTMRIAVIAIAGLAAIGGAAIFRVQATKNAGPDWVAQRAKPAILQSSDGKSVNLGKLYGKQPVVLVFYRGIWCPYCSQHLGTVAAAEAEFKKAGAAVFFISSEPAATLNDMRKRQNISSFFTFLSDPEAKLAKFYGGKNPAGYLDSATVVVNRKGFVTYGDANKNYQVRPTAETILAAIAK